jgi:hypothetical protein
MKEIGDWKEKIAGGKDPQNDMLRARLNERKLAVFAA